ncbi:MAG: SpoIIE family protein phosphatase [Planctomycetes bacterium]|nr:SpoIIE family protein phosphatase [Planctomycetota bacterium]
MDSLTLEKLNGGLLYLYGAASRKDFGMHLECFLAELFESPRFSILVKAAGEDEFYLEHTSVTALPDFERPTLVSPELGRACRARKDQRFDPGGAPTIAFGGEAWPVRTAHVIDDGGEAVGVLALHGDLVPQGGEEAAELEEYILNHVSSAFQQVAGRESLREGLEASDLRLQAIREVGEVLGQLDLETLLSHLMAVYMRLTEAQAGSVTLEGSIGPDVEWGLPRSVLERIRESGGQPLAAKAAASAQTIFVRGYGQDPRFDALQDFSVESFLSAPLLSKGRVLGTVNLVNVGSSKAGLLQDTSAGALVTISSLAATAIENAVLHRDLLEKERIKANLQIARTIQRGMYPVRVLEIPGYDMAWLTRSCDETGGDYFDFFALGDERACFVIGDVSGHGIGAALLMATGRANLRALLSVKEDLKDVMDRLNDLLSRDMDAEKFMTLFLGCLDHRRHQLHFVNAGHDQPLLCRARDGGVQDLETTGVPLGMMPGWSYDLGPAVDLAPGDALLMTTDGVWEATSPEGERFGKERLRAALARHAAGRAQEIVDAILVEVERYTRGLAHPDDLTLGVVKRVG